MKILRVLKDEELTKTLSDSVKNINTEIKDFCINLSMTMRYNNGIGIAAPQVGVLKRIIVIDVPTGYNKEEDRISCIMINPKVIKTLEEQELTEGCLSFPQQKIKTKRPRAVIVKWTDTMGEEKEYTFNDLAAAVVLHEIDHLDGITFHQRELK